jgi:4-amino-4-deoxy-L-arabinose transferase-like glycosyltransferase
MAVSWNCNFGVIAASVDDTDLNCYIRDMLSTAADTGLAKSTSEETGDGGERDRSALWVWAIIAVGAVLRLVALGHKSFWLDEIASVAIAHRAAPAFWHFLWHDEGNMALYYVLLRPWLHFGNGEGTVRVLSVVPGILSIAVMYLLGKRLFGRETGVLAAALLALNPCAIATSQEARAYSLLVLAVLLSSYLFVLLIEKPSYTLACCYAIVAGLSCYFHYFGVLVPAAHAISLLALPQNRRPWKPLILAAAIIVVAAAPILWLIHAQDIGHISWVKPPSLLEFYHLGVFLAASGGKAAGAVLLALDLLLVGFFAAKLWAVRRDDGELQRWRYTLVASSVVSPIVITLLVSIVRPVFYHRFLILCLPGWVLMTALGAEQIRRRRWRAFAIAGVCGLSLVSTAALYRHVTEDWRGAVSYLIANAATDDRVLYYQSVGQFAGESYRDWLPGGNERRPAAAGVNPPGMEWKNGIDRAGRVWLVLYRAEAGDPQLQAIEQELASQYVRGPEKKYRGVSVVEYSSKR